MSRDTDLLSVADRKAEERRREEQILQEQIVADWLEQATFLRGPRVHLLFTDHYRVNVHRGGKVAESYFMNILDLSVDGDLSNLSIYSSSPPVKMRRVEDEE
jgi:hypothetical protein